jgi:hypothetical protein
LDTTLSSGQGAELFEIHEQFGELRVSFGIKAEAIDLFLDSRRFAVGTRRDCLLAGNDDCVRPDHDGE